MTLVENPSSVLQENLFSPTSLAESQEQKAGVRQSVRKLYKQPDFSYLKCKTVLLCLEKILRSSLNHPSVGSVCK